MRKTLVFRADSSPEIGMGHVYRLISLIKYLHKEFKCLLVTNNIAILPHKDLETIDLKFIEVDNFFQYSTPDQKDNEDEIDFDLQGIIKGDEIVILDGYWFGQRYQQAVKLTGAKLVVIDDFADGKFYADIIINHAPGIHKNLYKALPNTVFLLGAQFAIIRPAFLNLARRRYKAIKRNRSIIICFGGTDFLNYTNLILETILPSALFDEINVVIGKGYANADQLKKKYGQQIILHHDLNEQQMADLMAYCEMAVVPSSSVLYEALAAGCKVLTGYYTQNQKLIYDGFVRTGEVIGCNDFKEISSAFSALYHSVASLKNQNSLIDGFSDARIKSEIEKTVSN